MQPGAERPRRQPPRRVHRRREGLRRRGGELRPQGHARDRPEEEGDLRPPLQAAYRRGGLPLPDGDRRAHRQAHPRGGLPLRVRPQDPAVRPPERRRRAHPRRGHRALPLRIGVLAQGSRVRARRGVAGQGRIAGDQAAPALLRVRPPERHLQRQGHRRGAGGRRRHAPRARRLRAVEPPPPAPPPPPRRREDGGCPADAAPSRSCPTRRRPSRRGPTRSSTSSAASASW